MGGTMETIDCIKSRRSRRLFLDTQIPDETINTILTCGIAAPSSVDCQPWHFVVVRDRGTKEKLAALKETDNRQHILTAPISILVCVDTEKSPSRYVEDGVTATQNILLAAHDLGLGSVYVTACKLTQPKFAEQIQTVLSLPTRILPITILPIGYPDPADNPAAKTLVTLENIVHHDTWQSKQVGPPTITNQ
jgi:nitroreductase